MPRVRAAVLRSGGLDHRAAVKCAARKRLNCFSPQPRRPQGHHDGAPKRFRLRLHVRSYPDATTRTVTIAVYDHQKPPGGLARPREAGRAERADASPRYDSAYEHDHRPEPARPATFSQKPLSRSANPSFGPRRNPDKIIFMPDEQHSLHTAPSPASRSGSAPDHASQLSARSCSNPAPGRTRLPLPRRRQPSRGQAFNRSAAIQQARQSACSGSSQTRTANDQPQIPA